MKRSMEVQKDVLKYNMVWQVCMEVQREARQKEWKYGKMFERKFTWKFGWKFISLEV